MTNLPVTVDTLPDAFFKYPHMKGCEGDLVRRVAYGDNHVCVDRLGRVGNGGIVTQDYRCNMAFAGCGARVLVTERAIRRIAVAAEVRP